MAGQIVEGRAFESAQAWVVELFINPGDAGCRWNRREPPAELWALGAASPAGDGVANDWAGRRTSKGTSQFMERSSCRANPRGIRVRRCLDELLRHFGHMYSEPSLGQEGSQFEGLEPIARSLGMPVQTRLGL
jgi:hypothetical protein